MRNVTKALIAFGLVAGAATFTMPGADIANARGLTIDAPGIHAHIGSRHHHRYRNYRGYRGYGSYGSYGSYGYAPRRSVCGPYRTLQDGVCKPYRGY
jgi:hypothetical protein